jgi:hypothetical protein
MSILSHVRASSLNWTKGMATKELRELRHKYKAAYTSYMHCVQALSDATQAGVWRPRTS